MALRRPRLAAWSLVIALLLAAPLPRLQGTAEATEHSFRGSDAVAPAHLCDGAAGAAVTTTVQPVGRAIRDAPLASRLVGYPYDSSRFSYATNEAELARLGSRVQDFHDVLDPIAQTGRTTAVMGTSGGDVIAGGVRDLSPAQRALARLDDILGHLPGEHAEITALKAAAEAGVDPRAIVTSWDVCPACARVLDVTTGDVVCGWMV